jgi:hypothetical protein
MNDHIPDVTKMISDTPISDSTPHNVAELGMLCRRLERDVNDGIDRIKRLLAERDTARLQSDQKVDLRKEFRHLLGTDDVQTGITVVCDLKRLASVRLGYIKQLETEKEAVNQRIKRLEEAGDALANTQTYDLLETVNWRKSKEAKP